MADYAGAVAAMRARFEAAWAATTPVAFQNEEPPLPIWPPEPAAPWIYFEVIQTASHLRGVGVPGALTWLTTGNIFLHLFVPLNYGQPDTLSLAGQAGEIFRAATFYASGGAKVVTIAPQISDGASNADNGNWFGVTVSIPFEFYFND